VPKLYRLTLRHGGRVKRSRFAALGEALADLRAQLDTIAAQGPRDTVHALTREFDPVAQVVARATLKAPRGVRAGVDLRGDGSTEAWTGRWQRRLVAREAGEDTHAALRRTLSRRPGE